MSRYLDRMTPLKQTRRSLIRTYWANANGRDWRVVEWLGEFLNDCAMFGFDPSLYPDPGVR